MVRERFRLLECACRRRRPRITRGAAMTQDTLLIPGPTPLPPEVLRAMEHQMISHRGPEFGRMIREILDGLGAVFETRNEIIPLSSSGTGGLEASIVNFLSAGDRVL